MNSHFDYIICGAGCAGLSLAIRLSEDGFKDKKILILDKFEKNTNDRTWSFWTTKDDDRYQHIYTKTWHKLAFYSPNFERIGDPYPYQYNTIKGLDFYQYAFDLIRQSNHITFEQAEVTEVLDQGEKVRIQIKDKVYTADYVFDSVVRSFPEDDKLFVWQHFLGWEIELEKGNFDDSTATFMDFRIDQGEATIFVYVLPFTDKTALVEVTFFSKKILKEEEYEALLIPYLSKYVSSKYKILKKEIGAIPMTTAPFSTGSKRVIPIGTNNGTVKPSSGYAFTRIQKESDELVCSIKKDRISRVQANKRFLAYDRTLLNVLITGKENGRKVFTLLFQKNKWSTILKFLNEETSIMEETKIFTTLPFFSFLRAFTLENVATLSKSKNISKH